MQVYEHVLTLGGAREVSLPGWGIVLFKALWEAFPCSCPVGLIIPPIDHKFKEARFNPSWTQCFHIYWNTVPIAASKIMLVKSVKYLEVKEIPLFFFFSSSLYCLVSFLSPPLLKRAILTLLSVSQLIMGLALTLMIQLKLFLLNARVSQTEWLTWSSSYLIDSVATL